MIYQVMEALDVGDAVSDITRRNATLLAEFGEPSTILTRHIRPPIAHETRPCEVALETPDCALIFHYWGYNTSTWLLQAVRGRKAVHYHNITPPEYFERGSPLQREMTDGYRQLAEIADDFDLVIGDSRYNVREFARHTSGLQPRLHLHPVVEPDEITAAPYDTALLTAVRQSARVNFVFVGRLARNKRQDVLIHLFDYYFRSVDQDARLWLVGNDRFDPSYTAQLGRLRTALPSRDRIVLTGKVSDPELHAYLRAADVFVCASEHEGFCVPIAQAMALGVPVVAYAAAAVPETMGGAGVLVHDWDTRRVGELVHLVLTDLELRQTVVAAQRAALGRFSRDEARARLAAIVAYLRTGESSPLFERDGRPASVTA